MWPFNSNKPQDQDGPVDFSAPVTSDGKMLDDTKPRFDLEDIQAKKAALLKELKEKEAELVRPPPPKITKPVPEGEAKVSNVVSQIGVNDFKTVTQIPCFRDAMITGFITGGSVLGVMLSMRRSTLSAANWAIGGFTIGAVAKWEMCRYNRKQSFENAALAHQVYAKRKALEEGKE
ncbi:hypothetical protein B0I72DRAFT_18240 [Yarrowia lipolytica]|jgi:cytochrome c oxidase assembly protein subunit 20|uniref:Cytochrome c oxidase assembly protein COX20, mitochondrial n=2 Tax=Yarrowia lipolytica TaxID=4952 RepID=Q6CCH4_YARLI|nr:YALI0C09350p [Yarrowia lipolytica CLIB122]AOW02576.1 hypothetical protein YALI1_C13007g [Yarrowia lipolytica]KAB8280767.1 hypothetical protein BKA91DRAFT_40563 [Yarrowia lipolytica]KAE8169856.1 hypothetical protein BKA90DRAFT_43821 [Yarrowia lipolytica]KAJ8053255.1 hypothetical protein LXG23DRAFT_37417 [Yarrowia lipolytica]QNP96521.1 Cytochrome c oxidase assembly protein COX20 [Yarrowia lipolytica]|eukprot:XP_501638.1 YALI0C09350p [Yarrowia lipolytica CLIB122]